jgi:hypothetical protein
MRTAKNKSIAFLFLTHQTDDVTLARFQTLEKAIKKMGDVFFLVHKEADDSNLVVPSEINSYIFNYDSIGRLDYKSIEETIVPGSTCFAVLQFYKDFPNYNYYWTIEYDVVFTGKWKHFFKTLATLEADLLTSHIKKYDELPKWYWWDSLKLLNYAIDKTEYIKSFNPVYRLSGRALALLDKVLSDGNSGHYEVLIPTVLHHYHYSIVDFGGQGTFVPTKLQDKFYLNLSSSLEDEMGTMRFRPSFQAKDLKLKNKLYHPVKP